MVEWRCQGIQSVYLKTINSISTTERKYSKTNEEMKHRDSGNCGRMTKDPRFISSESQKWKREQNKKIYILKKK